MRFAPLAIAPRPGSRTSSWHIGVFVSLEFGSNGCYQRRVDTDDEAEAFAIARELIAEHGDDVARVVQDKIDAAMTEGDLQGFSRWFFIRNAVTMSLGTATSLN